MVKAMAPNAASGAALTTMRMIPKNIFAIVFEHMAYARAGIAQAHADDSGEYGDDQGLQDVAVGQRREEADRDHVHQ